MAFETIKIDHTNDGYIVAIDGTPYFVGDTAELKEFLEDIGV